jgi:hypothetical protein
MEPKATFGPSAPCKRPRPFVGLLEPRQGAHPLPPRLTYTSYRLQHDPCPRGGYARGGSAGELRCSEHVHLTCGKWPSKLGNPLQGMRA